MDLRQSPQYAKYMSQTGWQALLLKEKEKVYAYKRPLGPFGSIVKIQRFPWPIDLTQLDQLAKKHKALFIKLEPIAIFSQLETRNPALSKLILSDVEGVEGSKLKNNLKSHGFHPDKWPLIPTNTRVINLTKSPNQLLAETSENCRRNINKAKKNQLKIKMGDWPWFYQNWKQTARKQNLAIPSSSQFLALVNSLKSNIHLISCIDQQNNWLAGIVMPIAFHTAYYLHASSTAQGKHLRAPYLAVWTAITLAKKLKCTTFDFDGIADPRYPANNDRAWQGFTEFKSKFGGQQITYIGSFIKYYGLGKTLGLLDKIFN